MSPELALRRATESDMPMLIDGNAAIARETEALELDESRLHEGIRAVLMDPARGFYMVAETADGGEPRIAGQLMITYEWSDWRNAFFWWIQSVYVWPAWRRQGVYRALHAQAERMARESGACGLRLYVERTNATAQATYRALGMRRSHYDLFETDFGAA